MSSIQMYIKKIFLLRQHCLKLPACSIKYYLKKIPLMNNLTSGIYLYYIFRISAFLLIQYYSESKEQYHEKNR